MSGKHAWTAVLVPMILIVMAARIAAQPVALPAKAVTQETVLVVWLDAQELNPEALRAAAKQLNAALPKSMQATKEQLETKLDEKIGEFKVGYDAFTQAGGQGALLLARAPEGDAQPPEPTMLLRVAPGTSPEEMRAALKDMQGAEDTALAPYGEGWLTQESKLDAVPTGGSAEEAKQFQQILSNTGASPVRVAFRMNSAIKSRIQKFQQQSGGGPAMALVAPLLDLRVGWGSLGLGDDPAIGAALQFNSAEQARRFGSAWENLLMMGRGMVQMQLSNSPNAPKPETIQALFNQLQLKQDQTKITARLGSEFIQRVGEMGPALQVLVMQMMMGGQGRNQPVQSVPPQQQ